MIVQSRESPEPADAEPEVDSRAPGGRELEEARSGGRRCRRRRGGDSLRGNPQRCGPAGAHGASRELVVHLRSNQDVATTQAALLACLRERPDLHLQVEVHVVGYESGAPLWTGRYIAGARGRTAGNDAQVIESDACQRLTTR